MAIDDTYWDLLRDTEKLLCFHQTMGLSYPCNKDLTSFLQSTSLRPESSRGARSTLKPRRMLSKAQPGVVELKPPSSIEVKSSLADIRAQIGDCNRCSLHKSRSSLVFGAGSGKARLLIVGEWPSAVDDRVGELFSSTDGDMLDRMLINVLKTDRSDVYLTSTLKCMVPEGIIPASDQINACLPFLWGQIAVIQPTVICAMGVAPSQALLRSNKPLVRLRGRFHDCKGIPLMPTFHPAFLLKNPEMKKAAFVDLQMILKKL